MERLFWEPSLHLCSVYSPAFSVNNHCYICEEKRCRETQRQTTAVKRIAMYAWLCAGTCPQISDFLTSGVFFLNSRLRSISFFLVCSLSSCLLASCVAVASSSFCNTNTRIFSLLRKQLHTKSHIMDVSVIIRITWNHSG